jgi:hypothetical protein
MHDQPLASIHATHAFSLHTEITMENQPNSPDVSATRNNGILNPTSTSNPDQSPPTCKGKSVALLVIKQEAERYMQSCPSNQPKIHEKIWTSHSISYPKELWIQL